MDRVDTQLDFSEMGICSCGIIYPDAVGKVTRDFEGT